MNAPLRRGACPGLSAPMPTGDGLLVRLLPIGTVPLAAFAGLCAAARDHGNGVVEVTSRGSIQIRGLSETSAPRFAAAVALLGIAATDGVAVHTSPLAGLGVDEIFAADALGADLRCALASRMLGATLAPKISIMIDGGGAPGLDGLSADVRLHAERKDGRAVLAVSVGGDRAAARHLGFVAPKDAVTAVMRLLEIVASRGHDIRARDILNDQGFGPFSSAVRDLLLMPAGGGPQPGSCLRGNERQPIVGTHRLRDGALGCGVGLAFGHADAASLINLAAAASASGASGLRASPERALIFIGFSPEALRAFSADAQRLGFVVRASDPRRFVVACPGAPICASAHIAARALAPRIAADCASLLGDRYTIHVSGCIKGCAHPAPASLTVIGAPNGCGLVRNGTVRDSPFTTVTAEELPAALARHARASNGEARDV